MGSLFTSSVSGAQPDTNDATVEAFRLVRLVPDHFRSFNTRPLDSEYNVPLNMIFVQPESDCGGVR